MKISLLFCLIGLSVSHNLNYTNSNENPLCEEVNWQDYSIAISLGHYAINYANDQQFMKDFWKSIENLKFSLGKEFNLTKHIANKTIHIQGVIGSIELYGMDTIKIKPLRALTETELEFGAEIQEIGLRANVELKYATKWNHTNNQAIQMKNIHVNALAYIQKPQIQIQADILMYKCAGSFKTRWTCRWKSALAYLKSVCNLSFGREALSRIGYAHVNKFDLNFTKAKVQFQIEKEEENNKKNPKIKSKQILYELEKSIQNSIKNGAKAISKKLSERAKYAINRGIHSVQKYFESRCYRRRFLKKEEIQINENLETNLLQKYLY